MKRLVLVRHGETEWSRTGRHTSRTDIPLTDAGAAQARALARVLADLGVRPTRVLSSPRTRAVQTAELAGLGPDIERTEALAEFDYGDDEGRTRDEIRAERPGWDLFRDGCPGGETVEDVAARVVTLVEGLDPESGEGDVVLVAHGHVLRVLAATYLGLPAERARVLALDTAAVSLLGHDHEWRALLLWNLAEQAPSG